MMRPRNLTYPISGHGRVSMEYEFLQDLAVPAHTQIVVIIMNGLDRLLLEPASKPNWKPCAGQTSVCKLGNRPWVHCVGRMGMTVWVSGSCLISEGGMMFDVALSTMWAIGQFQGLADFFVAGEALGFAGFELNHEVNSAMLSGSDLRGYRITSIHEPCPADIPTSELKAWDWLISSLEEDSRQQAVRVIQRSIDLAQYLGVRVIVVHPGRVDVDQQLELALRSLFETGQTETPAYQEIRARLIDSRAAGADAHLDAVCRSLAELADYAGRAGVRLGLENRYYYLDIPLLDEMAMLLELTNDGRIGFWYDVGHAQALENLGFDAHSAWLKRYASHMLGVHLHDLKGLKDHLAAGLVEIDWDMVAANLPEDAIRVCEFRSFNQPEQVAVALRFLVNRGCVALS